ncbi:lipopolysaccharide assembly protein LapA domain-containing protein [Alkalimarinus sediminis]|uniref:LapA family protein n=1 Tax=Alkalimarinus sediminis TaxID=1632866 RepID=A0A9E8HL78_9ALTE|nr:LapA family protein [Alkalimarinus sediminis]UZW76665.1 LapA family protein [Alkalimarinus sediminis]
MSLIRRIAYFVLALVILLVGVLFTSRNNQLVSVDYLIGQTGELYLAFWLISSFVLGGVLGVFACSSTILRLKTQKKRTEKKVKHTEVELSRLKGGSA